MPQTIYILSCEDALEFVLEAGWGFAEVDSTGKFTWLNPAFEKILNAPAALILGRNLEDWIVEEDKSQCKLMLDQVLQGLTASFTLSMRYIQRGNTPQNPRLIWGMLSVAGKWSKTKEFSGYRIQFQPYDRVQPSTWHLPDYSKLGTLLTEKAKWAIKHWKVVLFVIAMLITLIRGDSEWLSTLLKQVQEAKQSVDGLQQP